MSLLQDPPADPATPVADPTPSASFDHTSILAEDGSFKSDANWEEALKPLGVDVSPGAISKYSNLGEFLKGHAHLTKMATGKTQGLVFPSSADDTAAVQAWRDGLGVPASASEYNVEPPKSLPEGVEFDRAAVEPYLEVLHKHHATPELVQELVNLDATTKAALTEQLSSQQQLEADKAMEAEQQSLKAEFGAGLPEVLSQAARAAIAIGLDPKDNLFSTAKNVKAFNDLASKLGEDNLPNSVKDQQKANHDQAMGIMQNKPGYEELSKRYYAGDEEVAKMVQSALRNA